jgi:hypothetical protein
MLSQLRDVTVPTQNRERWNCGIEWPDHGSGGPCDGQRDGAGTNAGTNVPTWRIQTKQASTILRLSPPERIASATKDKFRQAVRPDVELHVSDVISLDFSLQVVAEKTYRP